MTKSQIQVPEDLFREIRALSKKRGWSLAETFRRGAELLLQVYPDAAAAPNADWRLAWRLKGDNGVSAAQSNGWYQAASPSPLLPHLILLFLGFRPLPALEAAIEL